MYRDNLSDTFKGLLWNSSDSLFPGTHHTEAPDEHMPWNCVSEIIPGLYLTCAFQASNKEMCISEGVSLVLNLCGSAYVSPYRVYEYSPTKEAFAFRRFDSLDSFAFELDTYTRTHASRDPKERKFFMNTVAALDIPTYEIGKHFPEMCGLIEIVLRNRSTVNDEAVDYKLVPSVMVHCMVGVSRSASVVLAYLMKRAGVSKDEALSFVRCTRPVVNPNPGFQQQLQLWEDTSCLRIIDEWSAAMVAHEVAMRKSLVQTVDALLPVLLRSNKCSSERKFFGFLIASAEPTHEELANVHRSLRVHITAAVDSEVYSDVPNFFSYVCELILSIDIHVPQMMEFMKCHEDDLPWNDGFYHRVFQDIGRSGFVKDTYDTVRAFCSLLEIINSKHFFSIDGRCPRAYIQGEKDVEAPADVSLSFSFLPYVVPYGEGFVQFSELEAFQKSFPAEGCAAMDSDAANVLVDALATLFSSSLLITRGGLAASDATSENDRWSNDSRIGYLRDDIEIGIFEKLERGDDSLGDDVVHMFAGIAHPLTARVVAIKTVGGVLAFRLFLETVEEFAAQAYEGRFARECLTLCERRLPLSVVSSLVASVEAAYSEKYGTEAHLMDRFKASLDPIHQCGVLRENGGVWSLLRS